MPRYYFHMRDGHEHLDEVGTELVDDDAARCQAVVASGEALRDLEGHFWHSGEWIMQVANEAGDTVCKLRFSAD